MSRIYKASVMLEELTCTLSLSRSVFRDALFLRFQREKGSKALKFVLSLFSSFMLHRENREN